MSPIKVCPCCVRAFTAADWARLPLLGDMLSEDETGTYRLELRNCSCGSTLAVEEKLP